MEVKQVSVNTVQVPSPPASEPSTNNVRKVLEESKKVGAKIATQSKKEREQKEETITQAVSAANKAIEPVNKKIKFREYPGTNRKLIQVIDSETNEIILEIPPVEVLNLAARIRQVVGLILDRSS